MTYRNVKENHRAPLPGELLATSGLFVMLALLAEVQGAEQLASLLAWGFDLAAFMALYSNKPGAVAVTPAPAKGK